MRSSIDRMDHPLSHTAAVVAGVAAIPLAGCAALLLSDSDMLRSSTWWSVVALAGAVVASAIIGYLRPCSRIIYVPVILSGLLTLSLCVWHLWWILQPESPEHLTKGLVKSLVFFGAWLAWATRKFRQLRARRKRESMRDAAATRHLQSAS